MVRIYIKNDLDLLISCCIEKTMIFLFNAPNFVTVCMGLYGGIADKQDPHSVQGEECWLWLSCSCSFVAVYCCTMTQPCSAWTFWVRKAKKASNLSPLRAWVRRKGLTQPAQLRMLLFDILLLSDSGRKTGHCMQMYLLIETPSCSQPTWINVNEC